MATTRIEVLNGAFRLLRIAEVATIDPDDKFQVAASNMYESVVVQTLAKNNWRFATKFMGLSRDATKPDTRMFEYSFELPADYLSLVRTEPHTQDYNIYADNKLYSNHKELSIEYRFRPDEAYWPIVFANYLSAEIAFKLALSTISNRELAREIKLVRDEALEAALFSDQSSIPNQSMMNSVWLGAR